VLRRTRQTDYLGALGEPADARKCKAEWAPRAPLDTGIRTESNSDLGEPDEVVDGEVNAHLGNPSCERGF
jgi:hypothetical protein